MGSAHGWIELEAGAVTPYVVADEPSIHARASRERGENVTSIDSTKFGSTSPIGRQESENERLRAEIEPWKARLTKPRRSATSRFTNSEQEVNRASTRAPRYRRPARSGSWLARLVSVHSRDSSDRISRQALDDAPVRRIWQRHGHERALQVPARSRTNGSFSRVRFSDADGLRLGSSSLRRRSGQVRSSDLEPRRHGNAVRRNSARQSIHVDDDQWARGHSLRFYLAAAEKQGVDLKDLRGTIQNDILKEYMAQHAWVYPIEPALRLIVDNFAWSARARSAVEYDFHFGIPHSRGRSDGSAGAGVHAG